MIEIAIVLVISMLARLSGQNPAAQGLDNLLAKALVAQRDINCEPCIRYNPGKHG